MRWLFLIGSLGALAFAATPKSKVSAKAAPAKNAQENSALAKADKICRNDQARGKLDALRSRCADLSPENSAIATYWRLTLTDDPSDLRKGFTPMTLAKGDVDSRLLLAAGRYHFARGQIREMEDLVEIGRKARLRGPEIDTLKLLAAGK